ncbi:hypothetical protein ELI95_30670, partial [Klebsiella pneumoniae]|nr:hypothetical protein [Klebsiella pneumoniae]
MDVRLRSRSLSRNHRRGRITGFQTISRSDWPDCDNRPVGTVAKLAMRQPFVLFKGLTFQKLCL